MYFLQQKLIWLLVVLFLSFVCYANEDDKHGNVLKLIDIIRLTREGFFGEDGVEDISRLIEVGRDDQYLKRAEKGQDAYLLYMIGIFYEKGLQGFEKNIRKAIYWYKRAAVQRFSLAALQLGRIFKNHPDVRDFKESHKWYERASRDGNQQLANYRLGQMNEEGRWIKKDYKKAIEYYEKSAEGDYGPALIRLGEVYKNGELGVKHDHEKALHFYRLAYIDDDNFTIRIRFQRLIDKIAQLAKDGNIHFQYLLGTIYELDIVNLSSAIYWYARAAMKFHIEAQKRLGFIYSSDLNNGKFYNPQLSFQWYKMAAENNDSESQNIMGKFYETGFVVKKDIQKAIKWYTASALNENKNAIESIKRLKSSPDVRIIQAIRRCQTIFGKI